MISSVHSLMQISYGAPGLGSGTYTVDGNGLRIKKVAGSTTTVYIFSGAKVIAEYQNGAAPSSPTTEYIYAGAALIAKVNSSGTFYYHQDHLSNRMVTNSSGGVYAQMGHFPFGESWYNASTDKLLFTTYERDSESGNDYAMARYHVSRLGRLSSPDPLSGSISNPQSLNRYSYSVNDPANMTDPSGLCAVAQNQQSQPANDSKQGGGDGPSADASDGSGPPQGANGPCLGNIFQWLDGSVSLDGGDITDNSGALGMGSPVGGGAILLGKEDLGFEGEWEWQVAGYWAPSWDINSSPLCGIINCGPPNPPPPPGYEDCMKGLAMANKNFGSVQRALDNWSMLQAAGDQYGVNPAMLGAIGIRETGFRNVIQPGPMIGKKTGFGIFQITNGSIPWMSSLNPTWAAGYAANLLASNMSTLQNKFPNFTPTQLLQATAASYNFGTPNISGRVPQRKSSSTTRGIIIPSFHLLSRSFGCPTLGF